MILWQCPISFECVAYALPILNSLKGEMSEFIENYNLGSNFKNINSIELINILKSYQDNLELEFIQKQNLINLYQERFQRDEIYDSFSKYIINFIK